MKKKMFYVAAISGILLFPTTVSAENGTGMYRLYNPNSGEHFYTAAIGEKDFLVKVGWKYEGGAWTAPQNGVDVYRLYNPNAGDHHYTTSKGEKDMLVKVGWKYEGVGWKSGGSSKVYRLYNPNAKKAGAHHYTLSKGEYDSLIKKGWKGEGVGWYAEDTFDPKVRVTSKTETTKEIIKYKSITKDDDSLYKGETKVKVKGQDGYIETTYKITYKDGVESKRQKVKENKKDAVDEVILNGTKDKITTKTETTKEILYFSRVLQGDDTMLIGETRLKNKGENGYIETSYKVTYRNGVEIDREVIKEDRKEPVDEVTLLGNIYQYTRKVDIWDKNYQMIKPEYVEDASVQYGQTKVLSEGEEGYYTIKELDGKIISKELTPTKNKVIGMPIGDMKLSPYYEENFTLFTYLSSHSQEELFERANNYTDHQSIRNLTKDEIEKVKSTIDMDLVTEYFLEYLNADRKTQGLEPVSSTAYGRKIATIRAQEQADFGSSTVDGEREVRPDGTLLNTLDSQETILYEEVSSATDNIYELVSEKYLAMDFYYNKWKVYSSFSFRKNYSRVSLGLGLAKGAMKSSSSSAFGRDEDNATSIVVFIAE